MTDYAFSAIPMLERPAKPRGTGQTMMIDFGLGLRQQEDILQLASEYIGLRQDRRGCCAALAERVGDA